MGAILPSRSPDFADFSALSLVRSSILLRGRDTWVYQQKYRIVVKEPKGFRSCISSGPAQTIFTMLPWSGVYMKKKIYQSRLVSIAQYQHAGRRREYIRGSFNLLVAVLSGFVLFSTTIRADGAQAMMEMKIYSQSISANIQGATLDTVLNKLMVEKGIWVKGAESVLREKVHANFVDLSIEYGLKKILSNLNYSLIFDATQSVVGVIILGRTKTTMSGNPVYGSTTVAMEDSVEDDSDLNNQEDLTESENSQDENSNDSVLPFLPDDYQYE